MNKETLNKGVENYKTETGEALQTVYDALNQGQQKKILKNEKVKELFDRFGVKYKKGVGTMEILAGTAIYTILQGLAFNVVLPIWYIVMTLCGLTV